jgi:hypothetical protein
MIIVVEVSSDAGSRASKEYDTPTLTAAVEAAERELRAYPRLRITNVWIKNDQNPQPECEEEW